MHILIIFLLLYIIIFKIICEWRRVDGMSFVTEIEEINIIVDILRTFFISAWTYYMSLKISDKKINIDQIDENNISSSGDENIINESIVSKNTSSSLAENSNIQTAFKIVND